MSRKVLHFILAFMLFYTVSFGQKNEQEKYAYMFHLLTLGLEEQGLVEYADIISDSKYSGIQEKATFFIAEYFLNKWFLFDTKGLNDIILAKTYYEYYLEYFPNAKNKKIAMERLYVINSYLDTNLTLNSKLSEFFAEWGIVRAKINFANSLITITPPNPFLFFFEGNDNENGVEATIKYFDDIIINNPDYEVYALYYKVILNLTYFDHDFAKEGLFDFPNRWVYSWDSEDENALQIKSKINSLMNELDTKYPHHDLTLNLHLILSKIYLDEDPNVNYAQGRKSYDAKIQLEFILKNDLNKLGIRYLLVKEFMLANEFQLKDEFK